MFTSTHHMNKSQKLWQEQYAVISSRIYDFRI